MLSISNESIWIKPGEMRSAKAATAPVESFEFVTQHMSTQFHLLHRHHHHYTSSLLWYYVVSDMHLVVYSWVKSACDTILCRLLRGTSLLRWCRNMCPQLRLLSFLFLSNKKHSCLRCRAEESLEKIFLRDRSKDRGQIFGPHVSINIWPQFR